MLLKVSNHSQLMLVSTTVKEWGNLTFAVIGFQAILSNRMSRAIMQR